MPNLKQKLRHYWPTFLSSLGFSVILYSMMNTQQLTNTFDGLWHQNYLHAGNGELASGRWLLRYVDKLSMGLHADPVISIGALVLFILALLLVLDLFQLTGRLAGFLSVTLLSASVAVCATLSYRYTSLGYGLSFFLAVFGVYALFRLRHPAAAILLSGLSLGLSLACYQANLGVYCVVAVYYLIFLCSGRKDLLEDRGLLRQAILRAAGALAFGAVFYLLSLRLALGFHHVSLSSYNGIGGLSPLGLLTGLPKGAANAYRYAFRFFFGSTLKINRLREYGIFPVFFGLGTLLLGFLGLNAWKKNPVRALGLLLLAGAIPLAANAYMLLVGDKLELQMTLGLSMILPLTAVLAFACLDSRRIKSLCVLLCLLLIYGSSMQVYFDQEAMYEGRNACETMAAQILDDLKEQDLLSADQEYLFVGVPAKNEFFSVSTAYSCANAYAQMGNFWVAGSCCQLSYGGLIRNRMGFRLPMSNKLYEALADHPVISAAPCFPRAGYITALDEHTVLIKVSEYAPYTGESKYSLEP